MPHSIISLGWYCGVSASLSKYNFRHSSGPFDWFFSEFKSVLHFMETDFSDFLSIENLEVDADKPLEFKDTKYGLHFFHDVQSSFIDEFELIREKYHRRIASFHESIQQGAYFIRSVKSQNELDYIHTNHRQIHQILTRKNDNNSILFLIPKYLQIPDNFIEPHYILDITQYQGDTKEQLQSLFDSVCDEYFFSSLIAYSNKSQ